LSYSRSSVLTLAFIGPVERQHFNYPLHAMALLTAAATFPLIFLGGLVTSHGAGMSVPDWPNSWGYNMFTFPPSKWVGGIFFEHTHRLLATVVGMLSIVLVLVAFKTDRRRWVRYTALGIFLAVLFQGVLGGLRVVLNQRDLAMVHGICAQIVFCFMATFCVMTSRFWTAPKFLIPEEAPAAARIMALAIAATIVIAIQLLIGAVMRHSDAGLAIPDFPTSFGRILPPLSIDDAFRRQAIHDYGVDLGLSRVTLFQIWIHFAHRIGAFLVTCIVIWLAVTILRQLPRHPVLTRPAWILLTLLPIQLILGILTVLLRKPADIASLHVAVGSLVLMFCWITIVRCVALLHSIPHRRAVRTPAAASPDAEFELSPQ
jgi:cytochrome c oxidase assembly protein subunit 15